MGRRRGKDVNRLPPFLKEAIRFLRKYDFDPREDRLVSMNTHAGLLEAERARPAIRRQVRAVVEAGHRSPTSNLADVSGMAWRLPDGKRAVWIRPGHAESVYVAEHELLHTVDFDHGNRGEIWVYKTHARLLKKEVKAMKRAGAPASSVRKMEIRVLYALDGADFCTEEGDSGIVMASLAAESQRPRTERRGKRAGSRGLA